jgi:hypothetical protein
VRDESLREALELLVSGRFSDEELVAGLEPAVARALTSRIRAAERQAALEQEVSDGILHLEIEELREELKVAIADRDALEQRWLQGMHDATQEKMPQELEQLSLRIAAIRETVEKLREQLRGAA